MPTLSKGDDLQDFLNRPTPNKNWLIDNICSIGGRHGLVSGRTGLGKTNNLLYLALCFATGAPFYNISIRRCKVGYYTLELGQGEVQGRLSKMVQYFPAVAKGMLRVECWEPFFLTQHETEFLNTVSGLDVVILDPIKKLVGPGDYVSPKVVDVFGKTILKLMRQGNFMTIFGIQVRKKNPMIRVEPDQLESIKGAGDYVEDAGFVFHLELTRQHKPGGWGWAPTNPDYITLSIPKHSESVNPVPADINLRFDYSKCLYDII